MENILKLKDVKKLYKYFKLDNISFELPRGYIMGLIGPNGAGKTTLIKLIMNLVKRDGGSIDVFGLDNLKDEIEIKSRIGFVYDIPPFYEHLSLLRNKEIIAPFYSRWDENIFREYLERFELDIKVKMKTLSRGMKMKFQLAIALSHDAELIILDEPTSGLDPIFRRQLLEIFSDIIQDEKKAILFSTHITSDLERIADYITFIDNGKLVFTDEKDIVLDSWGIVKGDKQILKVLDRDLFKGLRIHSYGFEALTHNPVLVKKKTDGKVQIDKPNLEDIMFYLRDKEEKHC